MGKKLNKQIFRKVRNANLKYRLIEDGDKVAVGVSGGKDSLTMLYFLKLMQIYTPLKFQLYPIYIDLGWENEINVVKDFCHSLELDLKIEKTNIAAIVFDSRQEKNPCGLCSNLRRGALNRIAKSIECNKAALGHHLDDAVNTMFLSMLYESRFNVFKPKTYLDRMDITIIRPLVYVEEKDIKQFIASTNITPPQNRCPMDGLSSRTEINRLLDLIESQHPGARKKFLASIENIGPDCFWK